MKQFSKIIFATMIGSCLAIGFTFFMTIAMIAGLASSGGGEWTDDIGAIENNSVLKINLNGPLKDQMERRDLVSSLMRYSEPPVSGLYELSRVLETAAQDDRIKGVLLHFQGFRSGLANAEALRRKILQFKNSGKFVIAYAEMYSEIDYVVASAVDEVTLYPKGYFEWDGLFSKMGYLKNTMEKLEVVPQVFRVGRYKSAIEPYISDKMSEASREQVEALIQGSWSQIVQYAAEKTKLSVAELNNIADDLSVMFASEALDKGFVSALASFEEIEEKLLELTGAEGKPKYVNWRSYFKETQKDKESSGNSVALIFASGGINTEVGDGEGISSVELSALIHKIQRDDKVKAVVIRVNSPGGSALASDVIWTATGWLKDTKPVVTSFGNVAASGGYYMSAGSQYIFAEPTTITGSIGVFGLSFATKKFWNDKVGMTFDTAKSHRFSDMNSLVRLYDPEESMKIQGVVDQIYEDFLNVVTSGREALTSRDQTHEIAQGRVWLGATAKEIGLVDELGGVDEAVAKAAELAQLSDYRVQVYPKELSPLQEFIKQMNGVSVWTIKALIPKALLQALDKDSKQSIHQKVQARLPFDIEML